MRRCVSVLTAALKSRVYAFFFSLGNGQWWAERNQKEFDQRGCAGPPDGHHRRYPDWPIHLWQMQGEELHLHTGTEHRCTSSTLLDLCHLVKSFEMFWVARWAHLFIYFLIQVQTRSADEPMTTFVFCNGCGNRWKVGHLTWVFLIVGLKSFFFSWSYQWQTSGGSKSAVLRLAARRRTQNSSIHLNLDFETANCRAKKRHTFTVHQENLLLECFLPQSKL